MQAGDPLPLFYRFILFVIIPFWGQSISATSLVSFLGQSTNCHQRSPLGNEELRSHLASTIGAGDRDRLVNQLLQNTERSTKTCNQPNLEDQAICQFGEDRYLRYLYLLSRFNINASPLQNIPTMGDGRQIPGSAIGEFSIEQLDTIIAGSNDVRGYLLPLDTTMPLFYLAPPFSRGSAGFNPRGEPPFFMVAQSNTLGEPGIQSFQDKVLFVHELCHIGAFSRNRLDFSEEWQRLGNWENSSPRPSERFEPTSYQSSHYPTREFRERMLSAARAGDTERVEALRGEFEVLEQNAQNFFVSDYGFSSIAEDFAESCTAHRYGVRQFQGESAVIRGKLEFVQNRLFRGHSFNAGGSGCNNEELESTSSGSSTTEQEI